MKVALIVAAAHNGVIGRAGDLPWRLPADMAFFRRTTLGHHVIMGRKTFASLRKPLVGRTNLVLSSQPGLQAEGCTVLSSLEAALTLAHTAGDDEIFVIGGASLYKAALPQAQRVYLTRVAAHVEGDVVFEALDPTQWHEVGRQPHAADDRHAFPFTICTYHRR